MMTKAHKLTLGALVAVVMAGSITPAAVLTGSSLQAPTVVGGIPAPKFSITPTKGVFRASFIPAAAQTIQASLGTWSGNPAPSFAYQWERCDSGGANCTNLVGQTAVSYTVVAADVGQTLRIAITGTNTQGSLTAISAPTGIVVSAGGGGGQGGGSGSITFTANFNASTYSQFNNPQCANTGTVSQIPRYRGTVAFTNSTTGEGAEAITITDPITPTGYRLTACNMNTPQGNPVILGSDEYQGIMIYVPNGWVAGNTSPFGVNFYELHFQNIYGAPITLQLHTNYVTLALETGACNNHTTTSPGCQYRSQAGQPPCNITSDPTLGPVHCLAGLYAVPVGAFTQGAWNEIVLHIHWAGDSTGNIQTYYKVKGASTWNNGNSIAGIPTLQWDITKATQPGANYQDQLEEYTAALKTATSISLDNAVDGTSLAVVEGAMP